MTEFRLTPPELPPPEAELSERQRVAALNALMGLTRGTCGDVATRAERIVSELNRRITDAAIPKNYIKGFAEVSVRQVRNGYVARRSVGVVEVDSRFDGVNILVVRVGANATAGKRFDERMAGPDFDRILSFIAQRAELQEAHELATAQLAAVAWRAAKLFTGDGRDPILEELRTVHGAVEKRLGEVYRVSVDVKDADEVYELARFARKLRLQREGQESDGEEEQSS